MWKIIIFILLPALAFGQIGKDYKTITEGIRLAYPGSVNINNEERFNYYYKGVITEYLNKDGKVARVSHLHRSNKVAELLKSYVCCGYAPHPDPKVHHQIPSKKKLRRGDDFEKFVYTNGAYNLTLILLSSEYSLIVIE